MNNQILISRINELCKIKSITRNKAFTESRVGKNFISNLRSANPSEGKLTMLADYFGVSVEYLKGETDDKEPISKTQTAIPLLTEEETTIIYAYRSQPEVHTAIKRVLGIGDDNTVQLWNAASSVGNRAPNITQKTPEEWENIKNAPETKKELL